MLELLDDLESADIYITPPVDDQLSEEHSDDDDDPQTTDHLSGQQLNAEADVKFITTSHKTVSPADESNSQETSDEEDSTLLAALMSSPTIVRIYYPSGSIYANVQRNLQNQYANGHIRSSRHTVAALSMSLQKPLFLKKSGLLLSCLNCFLIQRHYSFLLQTPRSMLRM